LRSERSRRSELDVGLNEIERRRLERVVHRYARQHRAYEELPRGRPQPLRFEVAFGQPDEDSTPSLELGDGAVRLQGMIDRIDLVHALEGTAFRVIDYKTGACPSKKSVHQALYLQLPLYALAVERLGLVDSGATLHDVGYWSVGTDGYKSIELKDWDQSRSRLEAFVLEVVEQLREGVFVIDPKKEDCTRSCDYRAVCRITQVRASGKCRDHVPSLDLDA
jgi:ATP-dependent helicase/nuclease subunit B